MSTSVLSWNSPEPHPVRASLGLLVIKTSCLHAGMPLQQYGGQGHQPQQGYGSYCDQPQPGYNSPGYNQPGYGQPGNPPP